MRRAEERLLRIRSTSRRLALAATTLVACGVTVGARDVSIDAVSEIHASRDGRKIALVSRYQDGDVINVLTRTSDRVSPAIMITEASLSKFLDEANISSVEWSATGRWLKIEINDGDVDQAIVVLDVTRGIESLQEVKAAGRAAASASWATSGDRLYLATALADDFRAASDDGIYVIEFPEGKTRHLAKGIGVSARLAVAGKVAITKVQQIDGDAVKHILVEVDLVTGNVKRLLPK